MTARVFHRISDPEYAQHPDQMLDGQGAFLYGGRWNSPGHRMVYLAQSLSLAAYELLVHVPGKVLQPYKRIEVTVPEDLIMRLNDDALTPAWSQPFNSETTSIGDEWATSGASLALSVPSVLIPGERNILLSPDHPDFEQVTTSAVMDFKYAPRLARR